MVLCVSARLLNQGSAIVSPLQMSCWAAYQVRALGAAPGAASGLGQRRRSSRQPKDSTSYEGKVGESLSTASLDLASGVRPRSNESVRLPTTGKWVLLPCTKVAVEGIYTLSLEVHVGP